MADQERSLPKEAERIAALDDRGLFHMGVALVASFLNGGPEDTLERGWLHVQAGLWTGMVLKRTHPDDPLKSTLTQEVVDAQEALDDDPDRREQLVECKGGADCVCLAERKATS